MLRFVSFIVQPKKVQHEYYYSIKMLTTSFRPILENCIFFHEIISQFLTQYHLTPPPPPPRSLLLTIFVHLQFHLALDTVSRQKQRGICKWYCDTFVAWAGAVVSITRLCVSLYVCVLCVWGTFVAPFRFRQQFVAVAVFIFFLLCNDKKN